jgi:hypothetical protein
VKPRVQARLVIQLARPLLDLEFLLLLLQVVRRDSLVPGVSPFSSVHAGSAPLAMLVRVLLPELVLRLELSVSTGIEPLGRPSLLP